MVMPCGPILQLVNGVYSVKALPKGHSLRGVLYHNYKPKDVPKEGDGLVWGTYFLLVSQANGGPILYWGGLEKSMKKVEALTGMLRDGGTIEAIFIYRGEVSKLTFPAPGHNEPPKIEYLTPTFVMPLETLIDARQKLPDLNRLPAAL